MRTDARAIGIHCQEKQAVSQRSTNIWDSAEPSIGVTTAAAPLMRAQKRDAVKFTSASDQALANHFSTAAASAVAP